MTEKNKIPTASTIFFVGHESDNDRVGCLSGNNKSKMADAKLELIVVTRFFRDVITKTIPSFRNQYVYSRCIVEIDVFTHTIIESTKFEQH
jgi:hypothetical protein